MPKKLTTQQFIEKAKKVHGETYDYSLVKYLGSKKKVKIICKIHGVFLQKPNNHISNSRKCPKCSLQSRAKILSKGKAIFIEESNLIHNNKYNYELVKYKNFNEKVTIKCPIHGEFEQRVADHIKGRGCAKCGHKKVANSIRKIPIELKPLVGKIRVQVLLSYKNKKVFKSKSTSQILGCTWQEFKTNLEDNPYGFKVNQKGLDLDHIVPISKARTEQELIKLNHYTNFQLLPSYYNRWVKVDKEFNINDFQKWLKINKYGL